jgi:hypothetical protein
VKGGLACQCLLETITLLKNFKKINEYTAECVGMSVSSCCARESDAFDNVWVGGNENGCTRGTREREKEFFLKNSFFSVQQYTAVNSCFKEIKC